MASFPPRYKKKDGTYTYPALIRRRGHPTLAESFPSKAAAVAWAGRIESGLINGGSAPVNLDMTFGDVLTAYAREVSPTKKGCRWEQIRIEAVAGNYDLGKGPLREGDDIAKLPLKKLTADAVMAWSARRLKTVGRGTVNREWTILSSASTWAVEKKKWMTLNPFSKKAGTTRPPEPKHRDRLATDDELVKLAAAADTPPLASVWLVARFAIETAMRSQEILDLTPDRVILVGEGRGVARLVDTWDDREKNDGEFTSIKNGSNRDVAMTEEAVKIWQEAGGKGFGLTKELRDLYWRQLCTKAGVVGLHFHDLRHLAITRLSKKIPNPLTLARMTGHKKLDELMTYYNESAEDVARRL